MKKIILILAIASSFVACHKDEEVREVGFNAVLANEEDPGGLESVSALVINYALGSEVTSTNINDSTVFSHTFNFDLDKATLKYKDHLFQTALTRLSSSQYVIKGFNLVDKSGKVIYYIPYKFPDGIKSDATAVQALPIVFTPWEGRYSVLYPVIKK